MLGTDALGRDMLARLLAGGVFSLTVGVTAAAIAVTLGTAWGALAGYFGGRTDAAMMRFVDVLYGLPSILLVVLLAVAVDGLVARWFGSLSPAASQAVGLAVLFVAIGGTGWLTMSRVIRGQVLSLRAQPFMESCRAVGVPAWRQFTLHLLPNLVGPIVVYATLAVPAAILSESFLSFLGIGVREPVPSWGNLASAGLAEVNLVDSRWWLLAAPCAMIAATLVALNFVGDSLRARFDPAAARSRW
jgi:ABC-type dipeptide/oligopeptide/nickel transport system permease subunit